MGEKAVQVLAQRIADEFAPHVREVFELQGDELFQPAIDKEHSILDRLSACITRNPALGIPSHYIGTVAQTGHPKYLSLAIDIYTTLREVIARHLKLNSPPSALRMYSDDEKMNPLARIFHPRSKKIAKSYR